ncbi:MAG: TetR family transcriptional regulator [Candidatus Devosia phytovorans]|uniref:TetR family transcriptional regulator n=1 Tax=Candidatus Devosia phytovorans TaxID=3121372 RepID=A0AAJ5VR56_9HYPH|nr:TetR family transcriptional regulator [Devosia sp.]WEK03104.1 MAG: TetR family transcriptional regulator [Devosia sp.]
MSDSMKARRRHDPDRRERIIGAALEVIAQHGVAGTTHRRVAEAADVPLGSMTYHFDSLEELVIAAFTRLDRQISGYYWRMLEGAKNRDEACEAVVDIICGSTWTDPYMTQLFELYAFAARKPEIRKILSDWMSHSRQAMELHFPPHVARALDAVIEGATIHNMASEGHLPREEVRAMVRAIVEMG